MSTTYSTSTETTAAADAAAYGGFVDAIGGIATVVLTIIALAGTYPDKLMSIATIVFGAALLIQGGAMLTEFARSDVPETGAAASGGGVSALFLVGVAGIVLGVLALLNIHADTLSSVAVIAFGGALMLSSGAVWQLLTSRSMAARFEGRPVIVRAIANEAAAGSATIQAMAGLAVIVLGILAVAGINSVNLALIALLVAGASIVMTGSTLSGTMIGFMRREHVAVTQRVG
jgi:hypothetical protein